MRNIFGASIAALALTIATPAMAQDDAAMQGDETSQEDLDAFADMMTGLFQPEPLTAEQEARLPAARGIVGTMMPEGFYDKMMTDMLDSMLQPMLAMFSAPELVLGGRLAVDAEAIEELDEAQQREIMNMLDPAFDARGSTILEVITGNMGDMFTVMEEPMRQGLSKAYAARFDAGQLEEIAAFFATPTGKVFAEESMALMADPQVMQSMMQSMPAMLGEMGDMDEAMAEAMAALPEERAYEDLSAEERARLADLLNVDPADLPEIVMPPKPMDGADDDTEM